MKTINVEKSKSETYSVYVGKNQELKKIKDSFPVPTMKEIIFWDYVRPEGKYSPITDVSSVIKEEPNLYLEGLSYALRFAGEQSSSLFEWMIANLYELMDVEEETVTEFLSRLWEVKISIYEKKSKKEREILPLSYLAEEVLVETDGFPLRDVISMSMVLESFISWKCELLSMEEFYEIRDMFVPFGLGISQSKYKPEELLQSFLDKLKEAKEVTLLKKLGKSVPFENISPEICLNAWEELYFDETAND